METWDDISVPRLRRIIWKPHAAFWQRLECWRWLEDHGYGVRVETIVPVTYVVTK